MYAPCVCNYVHTYICRNALRHAFHVLAIDSVKSQQKVSICVSLLFLYTLHNYIHGTCTYVSVDVYAYICMCIVT